MILITIYPLPLMSLVLQVPPHLLQVGVHQTPLLILDPREIYLSVLQFSPVEYPPARLSCRTQSSNDLLSNVDSDILHIELLLFHDDTIVY